MSYNDKYSTRLEAAGHVLKLDEDGDVDHWCMDSGYHNGPGCANCNESWCEHCEDRIEPCIGKEAYLKWSEDNRRKQYEILKEEFDDA